ncbi:MAG: 4Fe-4S binding protein [Actinobacteria bacterium]|nr:4Fe-4S binding protein [Actinomycetota bacterium]
MRTARRISQIFFLLFFLFLFFQARYPYETWLPSDLFLRASPLVAIATILATRKVIASVLIAFIILLLTIPLGRFFCGWICPLGTIIDGSDNLIKRKKRKPRQRESTRFRSWKFAILAAVLVASLFSVQFIWFFDPIALLTRTITTVLYPVFSFLLLGLFNFSFSTRLFEDQVYSAYDIAQNSILPIAQPMFFEAVLIALVFVGILALGMVTRRFWCRNLCPLGALLGLFSKFRLTKRYVDETCNSCSICQRECKMNAIEDDYAVNNTVECIECMECVSNCKPHSVSYKFGKNIGKNEIDLSKRRFIQAAAVGLAGVAIAKTSAVSREKTGQAIRPPGAVKEDGFLDRCIRCQECVRICATTGGTLQPSFLQSGWEGIWTPISVPRLGYCEYNCNLCGQVCPTGAIQNLTMEKKQKLKMGIAYFDKSRCIPWYDQQDCLVCEEHCPTPDKAIKFDIREARTPEGSMRTVKFPYVDEKLCIGCGICVTKCPVIGDPGIFVTNAQAERIEV